MVEHHVEHYISNRLLPFYLWDYVLCVKAFG